MRVIAFSIFAIFCASTAAFAEPAVQVVCLVVTNIVELLAFVSTVFWVLMIATVRLADRKEKKEWHGHAEKVFALLLVASVVALLVGWYLITGGMDLEADAVCPFPILRYLTG